MDSHLHRSRCDHVHLASLSFIDGGLGSFISPNGLVITNPHIAVGQLQQISLPEKDYEAIGFLVTTQDEGLNCHKRQYFHNCKRSAWDKIAKERFYRQLRALQLAGFGSIIVLYVEELQKPDVDRLDGYHDSDLENFKLRLFFLALIYKDLEESTLTGKLKCH